MKQFKTVFTYEFLTFIKSKPFIILTVFLALSISIFSLSPIFFKYFFNNNDKPVVAYNNSYFDDDFKKEINKIFNNNNIVYNHIDNKQENIDLVKSNKLKCYIIFNSLNNYEVYSNNSIITDYLSPKIDSFLKEYLLNRTLLSYNLTKDEINNLINPHIEKRVNLLNEQKNNSYTSKSENMIIVILMLIFLYVSILIYGMQIATNVAYEKGSRVIEVLITTIKPVNLIRGKVFAIATAGLFQIFVFIICALIFSKINNLFGIDINEFLSRFNINFDIKVIFYSVLFFLLGYFIYSFIFGALGSMVSSIDEVNTIVTPLILVIVFVFLVTFNIVITGNGTDSMIIKVLSFIPFTSPIAMMGRIGISNPSIVEISLCILILLISIKIISKISANIYSKGVLIQKSTTNIIKAFKLIKKVD